MGPNPTADVFIGRRAKTRTLTCNDTGPGVMCPRLRGRPRLLAQGAQGTGQQSLHGPASTVLQAPGRPRGERERFRCLACTSSQGL